ncbi:MAG: SMP-30/gluconolactonase/LRE family protein [Bacteroidia bacterium]|nr:SMP-30/gluconolactonase/LRE family protein [Bacteroidia bacterium]
MVYAYDFDAQSGTIANRRVFIDSTNEDGVPDGMCIDREGGLWIARWDGWRVSRYDPEGKKVADIRVPVQYPTSCCFGGAKLDQLFITSSQRDVAPQSRHEQAMAGSLFYLDTDSQGFSARRFGVSA